MKRVFIRALLLLAVSPIVCAEDIESKEALARTTAAAEAGNVDAQIRYCEQYSIYSVARPPPQVAEWCEAAVAAGNVSAMVNYAQRFEYGLGVTEDMGKAVALYQKAAEKGNTFANLRLGMFYGLGNELPDRGKSCKHYMVGAKEYSYAQQALAACYEEGVPGFPKDIKKAVSYYEQAASAQIPYLLSHYKLGYLYFFGIGIEKNARLAAKFLIKGATAPQTFVPLPSAGYYILGLMYEDGDGVTKSDEDAFTNYMKGAEAGHPASQNKVGAKCAEGKGVTKDVNRALMWFTIAAANGFKDAAENRDKAEKLLKPAEIKRTQKLAKDWLEKHPTI